MAKVTYNIFQGNYQLAVGWGNAGALAGLEGILIANDFQPYKAHRSWGTYSPGEAVIRGDGTIVFDGYPSCQWVFAGMTRLQLQNLQDTYCGGGYSGKVTIRTATDNVNTANGAPAFENYNAVMLLTPLREASYSQRIYRQYAINFTRLVAL